MRIENEDEFLRDIIRQDEADGYTAGIYLQNQRYMNDAVAMGDEDQIRALCGELFARKIYKKMHRPARIGPLALLRSQRNSFIADGS